MNKCVKDIFSKSNWTPAELPVLVFWIAKAVAKLKDITIIEIKPIEKSFCFSFCFEISDDKNEAWEEPIPGRKEQRGAEIRQDFREDIISFIFISGFWESICFGIFVLFFIERISAGRPNKPVSIGRRGSLTGREKVKYPKTPPKIVTMVASYKLFSLIVENNKVNNKINGIIGDKIKIVLGIKNIKTIEIGIINIELVKAPNERRETAWRALPLKRNLCAGSIAKKESSSGTPKSAEGIKSIIIWVIERETMNSTRAIGGILEIKGFEREANKITIIRFMCSPGIRPVIVPIRMPMIIERVSSSII